MTEIDNRILQSWLARLMNVEVKGNSAIALAGILKEMETVIINGKGEVEGGGNAD